MRINQKKYYLCVRSLNKNRVLAELSFFACLFLNLYKQLARKTYYGI